MRTLIVCWFVTIAVNQSHRHAVECALPERSNLHLSWLASTPTANAFPAGACCAQVTYGNCSCALYSEPAVPGQLEAQMVRERQRFARKGWSSSKVARAVREKAESAARSSKPHEAAEAFNALASQLVAELGAIEVFAHFYNGNQHEETVGFPQRSSVSLQQFLEAGYPPDKIVTVSGAPG